jgi:hypothetical protein
MNYNIVTWWLTKVTIAWLRLDKHVSAATDTRATIEEVVEKDIFYAVRDEAM